MSKSQILIADDDESLSTALKIRLESMGFEVVTASNGVQALEVARERTPDLLILDVNMPGCGGFELIEKMDGIQGLDSIPVIYITGEATPKELFSTGERLGAMAMMRKPFETDALIANIHLILPPMEQAA